MRPTFAALMTGVLTLAACGAYVTPNPARDAGRERDGWISPPADVVTADASSVPDARPLEDPCTSIDPTDVIAPRVLLEGQTLGLTAISRERGPACGATPTLVETSSDPSWSLSACGGCLRCNCIDPGYEASIEQSAPPIGEYTMHVGSQTRALSVVSRDRCWSLGDFGGREVHLEVVGPDPALRQGASPRLWWLHVTASELRCCGEPHVVATVGGIAPAGADLGVSLMECEPDPCDCAGHPVPIEAWVDLGALSPGAHGVVVAGGSSAVEFVVPQE